MLRKRLCPLQNVQMESKFVVYFPAAEYLHETIFRLFSFLAFLEQQVDLDSLTLAQPLKKWFNTTNGLSWWWLRCGGKDSEWGQDAWVWVLRSDPAIWVGWNGGSLASSLGLSFFICKMGAVSELWWRHRGMNMKECRDCTNLTPSLLLLDLALEETSYITWSHPSILHVRKLRLKEVRWLLQGLACQLLTPVLPPSPFPLVCEWLLKTERAGHLCGQATPEKTVDTIPGY